MIIRRLPHPASLALLATLLLVLIEALLPFESISGSPLIAKLLVITFYSLLVLFVRLVPSFTLSYQNFSVPTDRLLFYIRVASFLGPLLLLYDRIIIRGFDLSLGIAALRYFMEDNSTGSISSIFSVLGYLLSALSFILLSNLVLGLEDRRSKRKLIDYALIIWSVLGVSLLTGGRTTLFLLSGFIYMNFYVRVNLLKLPLVIKLKTLIRFAVFALTMLVYVNYVFGQRASTNNIRAKDYYEAIISHLHGQMKEKSETDRPDFLIYTELTLAYFTHQYWIFSETLELKEKDKYGTSTFIPWKVILSKARIISPPVGWYYGGYYVPLVGAFIYEYGIFVGFLIALLFLSVLNVWGSIKLSSSPSLKSLTLYNYLGSLIIFSVVLPAVDIMMSPILFLALFVIYPIISTFARIKLY